MNRITTTLRGQPFAHIVERMSKRKGEPTAIDWAQLEAEIGNPEPPAGIAMPDA